MNPQTQISRFFKLFCCFVLLGLLSACASTDLSKYQKLSTAATTYADNYIKVVDLAADTAIEDGALSVIAFQLEATQELRKVDGFDTKATNSFENTYNQVNNIVSELGKLRSHLKLFKKYFISLASFSANSVADETSSTIKSTGESINSLVREISNTQDKEVFKQSSLEDLSSFSKHFIRIKTNRTLEEVIKQDIAFLNANLGLHQNTFDGISERLKARFERIGEKKIKEDLLSPLKAAKQPFKTRKERETWIDTFELLQHRKFNKDSLDSLEKSAEKFIEALDELANGPSQSTVKLNEFLDEVEELKKTIDQIRE